MALPVAVFSSYLRVVLRALLAVANCADEERNQASWHAFCSMSGFGASFPILVTIVLRHVRIVYKMRNVCLLFQKIASWSGYEIMISPSFIAALKRKGVG